MRLALILALLWIPAAAAPRAADEGLPPHQGAVNDNARVLSLETRNELEALSIALYRETGFALVILTVPSLPENTGIEEYAVKVYEKWGVGVRGKDAGALIVAAIKDRRMRIEAGYGAEGYLPDAICKRIIEQNMAPAFKKGNFSAGFASAAAEIAGRVAREFNVDPSKLSLRSPMDRTGADGGQVELRPFHLVLLVLLLLLIIGTRPGRRLLYLILISNILGGGRRSFGGGGFGGGFSSGRGFNGFGGGMSGGGGASGRW